MSFPAKTPTRFGFVKNYPADLAITSLAAVLAYLAVTAFPEGSHLRLAAALPLILVVPGYALVAVLFPASPRPARENARTPEEERPGGIDVVERWGLSFALSLAILPVLVIALALTEWHLTAASTAGGLAVVTIVLAQLGVARRLRLPESERYSASPRAAVGRVRQGGVVATASSFLLALGIVAAVAALTFALVAPQASGGFSELGIYAEDDDGDRVADFPDHIDRGDSIPIFVEIENEEGEDMEYEVVVQEQVYEGGELVDRHELDAFPAQIDDGERVETERTVTPETEEGPIRIAVLLYEGDERPSEPTIENADEDAYFWANVTHEGADSGFDEVDGSDGGEDGDPEETGDEGDDTVDEEAADDDEGDDDDDDDAASILEEIFGDDDDEDDDDDDG